MAWPAALFRSASCTHRTGRSLTGVSPQRGGPGSRFSAQAMAGCRRESRRLCQRSHLKNSRNPHYFSGFEYNLLTIHLLWSCQKKNRVAPPNVTCRRLSSRQTRTVACPGTGHQGAGQRVRAMDRHEAGLTHSERFVAEPLIPFLPGTGHFQHCGAWKALNAVGSCSGQGVDGGGSVRIFRRLLQSRTISAPDALWGR